MNSVEQIPVCSAGKSVVGAGKLVDDFKGPDFTALNGEKPAGAFRARLLAAAVTVILLGTVGWLRVRQRPTTVAAPVVAVVPMPTSGWQNTYQAALAAGGDIEGAAEILSRELAELERRLRTARPVGLGEETEVTELEHAWRTLRHRAAMMRSVALEEESAALAAQGQNEAVLEKLTAALRWQDEANTFAPTRRLQDFQRETRLRTAVELGRARSRHGAISAARQRADTALAGGDTAEAARALREAREEQLAVNQEFRDTKAAAPAALAGFESEIETLESRELSGRLQAVVAAAERAGAAGDSSADGQEWAMAVALQRELNARFPKSRAASAADAERFEVRRQTALSLPLLARAAELEALAASSLRLREIEPALGFLDEAVAVLDRVAGEFPRNARWNPDLARKIEYLTLKRRDLGAIRESAERVLGVSAPRPTLAGTGTLVPQVFFSLVMRANPSRNRGPILPVESVSWSEANEFCLRLSWVLGQVVRLPTETEFRLVAATERITERATEFGVWLQSSSDYGAMALVGSPSGGLAGERIPALSVASRAKGFRSLQLGFRFVAEPPPLGQIALNE